MPDFRRLSPRWVPHSNPDTPFKRFPPPTSQGRRASRADSMSHLLGLELRREAPPLLGPLLSPFPLPAGSWHRQMLRSSLRFPITNSAGAPRKAAGRMNILAPVRRDRVLAELPQGVGGEEAAAPDELEDWAQACHPARPAASGWSLHSTPTRAAWLRDKGQEPEAPFSIIPPTKCLRKEAALHVHKDFHPRVTCACQEHRTGTVGFKISKVIVVGDLSVGKTCLINRFCKDTFDKNYKATIGVDFEMERFEVLGVPFSLQLWDTAGQERFKCIASTYYRGAQAIIIVFNLNDVASLEHTKYVSILQYNGRLWEERVQNRGVVGKKKNACSKKDLSVSVPVGGIPILVRECPPLILTFPQTPAQYALMEKDALKVAQEMKAEYWAVSSLTGENVREFFFRVAALTFEANVLAELEKSGARRIGDVVRINSNDSNLYLTASKKKPTCCP
ncbi:Ras-related protein Rab-34 [Plecturocebus cupreus]